jgi:hypothetical protein
MSRASVWFFFPCLSLLFAAPGQAQSNASGPLPCTAPPYRQFDFWAGNWNVYDTTGTLIGTNRVEKVYGGCVLQENWVGLGPQHQTGSSFNTWNPGTRKWYQTWVDDSGGFLLLSGEFKDGAMVLTGDMETRRGHLWHRITWNQVDNDADQVRQFWETSTDQGQTWTPAFLGIYRRAPVSH